MSTHNSFALILGAGYGTRLERDLHASPSHQHLIGVNKCLLPLADGRPALCYWLDLLVKAGIDAERTYVVTNATHAPQFHAFCRQMPSLLLEKNLINNGTLTNETRLGAVADIEFAWRRIEGEGDAATQLVVVAGDTLFYRANFSVQRALKAFESCKNPPADALILCYKLTNDDETRKRGIIEVTKDGDDDEEEEEEEEKVRRVTCFLEKPDPSETTSRLAVPAFYVYSRPTLALLPTFLSTATEKTRDAPGNFVAWLCNDDDRRSQISVYAMPIAGRYDIGSLEDYLKTIDSLK